MIKNNNYKKILMTSILGIAMTFLIGFSAQEAFAGAPAIYDEPLDGTIVNAFPSTVPIADDFVIDTETTITDFHVLLIEFPDEFDGFVKYAIYEDDNGLPGALVPEAQEWPKTVILITFLHASRG